MSDRFADEPDCRAAMSAEPAERALSRVKICLSALAACCVAASLLHAAELGAAPDQPPSSSAGQGFDLFAVEPAAGPDDPAVLEASEGWLPLPEAGDPDALPEALLAEIVRRRQELDERNLVLAERARTLAVLEEQGRAVMDRLTERSAELRALLTAARQLGEAERERLASVYGTMRPRDAARILDGMQAEQAAAIVALLRPAQASAVMAKMQPPKAQGVTIVLGRRASFAPPDEPVTKN